MGKKDSERRVYTKEFKGNCGKVSAAVRQTEGVRGIPQSLRQTGQPEESGPPDAGKRPERPPAQEPYPNDRLEICPPCLRKHTHKGQCPKQYVFCLGDNYGRKRDAPVFP
jgi:hypothetical protein